MSNNLSEEEITRSHCWHAVECNNLAWDFADQPSRTDLQNEEMLNAAHASAFHWAKVGTALNQARARMLLAHVHSTLGDGRTAMKYTGKAVTTLLRTIRPIGKLRSLMQSLPMLPMSPAKRTSITSITSRLKNLARRLRTHKTRKFSSRLSTLFPVLRRSFPP